MSGDAPCKSEREERELGRAGEAILTGRSRGQAWCGAEKVRALTYLATWFLPGRESRLELARPPLLHGRRLASATSTLLPVRSFLTFRHA